MAGDIQRAAGDGKCTVLLALHISAAFDAVDHSVLGARVNTDFDIGGTVSRWIVLRRRQVAVGAERSQTVRLASGVSQGSILGPLLFAMYVSPIGQVVDAFGIQHHQYADDLMLYCAFTASQLDNLSPLVHCKEQSAQNSVFSNFVPKTHRFWGIRLVIIQWPWNPG